jgi:predicted metal-binding membrane protein
MPLDTTLFFCGRPPGAAWSFAELSATFAMWLGMMVAMMGPLVLPWLVGFARADGDGRVIDRWMRIGLFLTGYMAAWAGSGLVATLLQQALAEQGWLSVQRAFDYPWAASAALILVGLYQWTPLKDACLKHCQSPATFFLTHWRDGAWGAVRMGGEHGLHCIGCCGPLMVLMFVAGVMSLVWMIGVACFVLIEMYVPRLRGLTRLAGIAFLVLGVSIPLLVLV